MNFSRGPTVCVSGGEDGLILIHDIRSKGPVMKFVNSYQVTATTFNDSADQVISAGIDNSLKIWYVPFLFTSRIIHFMHYGQS
jgi:Prp8 binding protein